MMKYIFIFLICFISVQSFAQPVIKRNDGTTTALDSALFTGKAFRVPVFQDTVSANTYRVLDSSGRLIFTRDSSNLWVRTVSNGWQKVGFNNGGGS